MDRLQQEVALKNQHLDALNNNSNSAYAYQSGGTATDDRLIAQAKLDNTVSGPVPDTLAKDERAENKQNWKVAGIAIGITLIGILLIKFKIIKI